MKNVSHRNQPEIIRGFTMVELLVVIAIISILMAILLPALNKAKKYTKQIQCLETHRKLGVAVGMYISDYGWTIAYSYGTNPYDIFWHYFDGELWTYLSSAVHSPISSIATKITGTPKYARSPYACPEADDNDPVLSPYTYSAGTIGYNLLLTQVGTERHCLKGPSYMQPWRSALLMDANGVLVGCINQLSGYGTTAMRHNRAMNVLYIDLHADSRKEGTFSRYITNPSYFESTTSPFWRGGNLAYKNNPD